MVIRCLCLILMLLIAPAVGAQSDASTEAGQFETQDRRPNRRGRRQPADQPPAAEPAEEDDEEAEPPPPDEYFAITGGTVHTVSGPVIEGATILCKNGAILAIGPHITVPEDATILDAAGQHVYPGLVAVRSSGLLGSGQPQDTTNVFALNMNLALAAGITTAVTGNTAAKLTYGSVEDIDLKGNLFQTLRYTSRNPRGKKQMRDQFDRLQQYLRDLQAHEREKRTNPDAKPPDNKWIRGNFASYMRLLKGETVALSDAGTMHQLLEVCELAERYGIKFVVRGGYEAWTIAPRLSRAGVSMIVTPRERRDPNVSLNRPNGATIENASILHDHGIRLAFLPPGSLFGPGYQISLGGLAGRDLQHLSMEAAYAVRGGMPQDAAVAAITLDAARILGVDDRIGSIEVGKDADFAITDGDLLHYMTLVQYTVVNGRIAYDKQQNTLFSHIRPGGDLNAPPPDDHWPRRLGDDL